VLVWDEYDTMLKTYFILHYMRKRKVGYLADGIPFSLACLITSSNIKINHLNYFFYISICFYESWYYHIITNSILHFKVTSQQLLNSISRTISSNSIVSSITSLSDWCGFFSIIFLVSYYKWAILASKSCCLYLFLLIHYLCISKRWHKKT
jgi:hypothetical protein